MDAILQGIPNTICYIDDILITEGTESQHLKNLEEVLRRLQEHECLFFQDSVQYIGHRITSQGLHTTTKKVEVI